MARHRKLKEADYETVKKLAGTGLSIEMIADFLGIHRATAFRDEKFCDHYKNGYSKLGAKVRTMIFSKAEKDTTANIYLDKVINKTTEKSHDDNLEIRKAQLEIEKERLEIAKIQANVVIVDDLDSIAEMINSLPKEKLEELMKKI